MLAPDVIGLPLDLPRFDLSLARRRATDNAIVHEAARAIREHGFGLKAATVTPETRGDVGSPNRILREEIGGKVIVRTGRRIPGVVPFGGVHAPISVVRMAVGDAYGAKEWREGSGDDEVAFRTERIERSVCRAVAEFCVPRGRADGREGLRRAEVHGVADLRRDAQGGNGRLRGAPPRRGLRTAIDRCDVRAAGRFDRRPTGHPRPESRRRHSQRSRAAAVRLDRRIGVAARRVRGRRSRHRRR